MMNFAHFGAIQFLIYYVNDNYVFSEIFVKFDNFNLS